MMNCRLVRISALTLLAFSFPFVMSLNAQVAVPVRTVALSNSGNAPGTNPPLPFGSFAGPVINDIGQVAFFTELNGPAIQGVGGRGDALFTEANGLSQLFREDEFVPGSNQSQTLEAFPNVTIFSNSGQTLQNVGGRVDNGSPPRLLFRTSSSTDQEILVDSSGNVSGLSGVNVNVPSSRDIFLNDNGEAAFGTTNSITSTTTVISDTGGQGFRVIGTEGQVLQASQVAGLSQDVLLTEITSLGLNDSSQNLVGATFSNLQSALLLENGNGSFSLQAETGANLQSAGADVTLDSIFEATLNNRGDTVFSAGLQGTSVDTSSNTAVVGNFGGILEILAREGDAIPGTDLTFSTLVNAQPVLGGNGDTAFFARPTGSSDDGVFSVDQFGAIELIAFEGDTLTGLSAGEFINDISPLAINENGQIAFLAALSGTGVTGANNAAIFAQDINGNLELIVREGDLLNVSNDPNSPDFRTIEALSFFGGSGSGNGTSSGFNDLGQIAFRADLSQGEGVFVTNQVAVPEPSSIALLLLGGSVCLTRRRRRS